MMKKYLLLLFLISCKKDTMIRPIHSLLDESTKTWLEQCSPRPNVNTIRAVNNFFKQCRADGNLPLLDRVWATGQESAFNSYISLVNPTSSPLLPVNSPIQKGKVGVQGNGTTSYFNTQYNPTTDGINFTLNSNYTAIFAETTTNSSAIELGSTASGALSSLAIYVNNGNFTYGLSYTNAGTSYLQKTPSLGIGLYSLIRTSSTSHILYYGGINAGLTVIGSQNSVSFVNNQVYVCCNNNNGAAASFSPNVISIICFASGAVDQSKLDVALLNLRAGLSAISQVTYEGNSFFSGNGIIPSLIDTFLINDPIIAGTNYAASGSSISSIVGTNNYMQYTARYNAVTMRRDATKIFDFVVCHEGTNELRDQLIVGNTVPVSVTNTYNAYQTYYQGLVALGFTCVFNTILPENTAGTPATVEGARQNPSNKLDTTTVNGLLRTDFNIPTSVARIFKSGLSKWVGCYLVDIGDDPDFGQVGQWTNTTYYMPDLIHPTATLQNLLANNYFGACVRGLINNTL